MQCRHRRRLRLLRDCQRDSRQQASDTPPAAAPPSSLGNRHTCVDSTPSQHGVRRDGSSLLFRAALTPSSCDSHYADDNDDNQKQKQQQRHDRALSHSHASSPHLPPPHHTCCHFPPHSSTHESRSTGRFSDTLSPPSLFQHHIAFRPPTAPPSALSATSLFVSPPPLSSRLTCDVVVLRCLHRPTVRPRRRLGRLSQR